MTRHRSVLSRLLTGLMVVAGCMLAAPAPAQTLPTQVPSLKWIPANAGAYSVMLRNREQLDILLKSKAFAKLMSLPSVQLAKNKLDEEWANPAGPLSGLRTWYDQPSNADLVRLTGELVSDEIFLYADKNCAEFLSLLQDAFSPRLLFAGDFSQIANNPFYQYRAMLRHLSDNATRLKFPDFVIGMKLGKTKPAALAKKIDEMVNAARQAVPPPLQARFKKTTIHGVSVHTLSLDGSLVPWDMIPFAVLEDQPGELNNLRKKLKELKLTLAVCVRDDYLLFSVGEATGGLQALGAPGNRLIDRKELAPLVKFGDRRLTSISYVSKEYRNTGTDLKVDDTVKWVDSLLKDSGLTPVQQDKIRKDVRGMLESMKRYMPEIGSQLDFTFLNNRGYESYRHDSSKYPGLDSSRPLSILDHVGGQPIAFYASQSQPQIENYAEFAKAVKLLHGYFDEFAVPQIPEPFNDIYQQFMKQATPYFVRFDKATAMMLLPSLDGQGSWILDAKLKIKLLDIPQAMPVPELALALGLRDAGLFRKAMGEYREVFNGIADIIVSLAPPGTLPDLKIPLPKTKKAAGDMLYSWPLPEVPGLDPKIRPTGGIADKVAVFAFSEEHATRLLTKTPFKPDGGPLADIKKPLSSACYFNWAGLVDAAAPWVEHVLTETGQDGDVVDQVRAVLDVLRVFRSYSSATYLRDGIVVTHSETVLRDLEK